MVFGEFEFWYLRLATFLRRCVYALRVVWSLYRRKMTDSNKVGKIFECFDCSWHYTGLQAKLCKEFVEAFRDVHHLLAKSDQYLKAQAEWNVIKNDPERFNAHLLELRATDGWWVIFSMNDRVNLKVQLDIFWVKALTGANEGFANFVIFLARCIFLGRQT